MPIGGCSPSSSPSSGSGGTSGTSATATCPCTQRTFGPRAVNSSITQTISNAPSAYRAWNGTYSWNAKFSITVNRSSCTVNVVVKIKIVGSITNAQKTAWKSAIETKWSRRFKLVCNDPSCPRACPNGYPVVVEVQYVSSGEHQQVTANAPTATASGRAGLGGTTSMTGWGVNDTVDITHEFGHMLGNVDEYFTTNGVDYTYGGSRQGFRDSAGGVMNNPSNNPTSNNYNLIAREVQNLIGGGTTCSVQNI